MGDGASIHEPDTFGCASTVDPRTTGLVLAEALDRGQSWRHRKVESLRLMEGERGRRRVSVDCTPPPEPALAYEPGEREKSSVDAVQGLMMVPLTLVGKGTLKHFDVSGQDGQPLPVLGRSENADVALAALMYEVCDAALYDDGRAAEALRRVVDDAPQPARAAADALIRSGEWEGVQVFDPATLSVFGERLLRDLAENFLLVVLLPSESVGVRQVIKYSFHWRTVFDWSMTRRDRLLVASGFATAPLEVEVSGPSDAASYHLEVHAPSGLVCSGLVLPDSDAVPGSGAPADTSGDEIAHAVANYLEPPSTSVARLQMAVPGSGLRGITTGVLLYTAAVFLLEELLPGARRALLEAPDGAVAILLAVPAVVVAWIARPGENVLASRLLAPLRGGVLACAALLTAGAASLVGYLHEPWITTLWFGSAVVATLAAIVMVLGHTVGGGRDDDGVRESESGAQRG